MLTEVFFPTILAASLVFSPSDADVSYSVAAGLVEKHTPRDAGTLRGARAANFIFNAATAAGADARTDCFVAKTPAGEKKMTNVYASFEVDPAAGWIVYLSHFDTKAGVACPGANDGASTSGLLVGMCEALARQRRLLECNVMLLWTDGEECISAYGPDDGLWGARRASNFLKESGRKVVAVICLDMLGDRDLEISLPRNSSKKLKKTALAIAGVTSLKGRVKEIREIVIDDNVPFADEGFETINLIDFEYGSKPKSNDYWHTPNDTIDKISRQSLLDAGRFAVKFIDILPRLEKPGS